MKLITSAVALVGVVGGAYACGSCEHPENDVVLTRNVRRMQPESQNASSLPRAPLSWGQLNVIHTTDTHGWLEGHLKEENYGADWGDFVSFVRDMRRQAEAYDVDLLVVDTGVCAWAGQAESGLGRLRRESEADLNTRIYMMVRD